MKKSLTVSGLVNSGTIRTNQTHQFFQDLKINLILQTNTILNIPLSKLSPTLISHVVFFLKWRLKNFLASSLLKWVYFNPIAVRKHGRHDTYQIIAGERRFKAFKH